MPRFDFRFWTRVFLFGKSRILNHHPVCAFGAATLAGFQFPPLEWDMYNPAAREGVL